MDFKVKVVALIALATVAAACGADQASAPDFERSAPAVTTTTSRDDLPPSDHPEPTTTSLSPPGPTPSLIPDDPWHGVTWWPLTEPTPEDIRAIDALLAEADSWLLWPSSLPVTNPDYAGGGTVSLPADGALVDFDASMGAVWVRYRILPVSEAVDCQERAAQDLGSQWQAIRFRDTAACLDVTGEPATIEWFEENNWVQMNFMPGSEGSPDRFLGPAELLDWVEGWPRVWTVPDPIASGFEVGSIAGTVTDADTGLPVVHLCVIAYRVDSGAAAGTLVRIHEAGRYQVEMLEPGPHYVSVVDCGPFIYEETWYGQSLSWEGAQPVEVIAGQVTPGIDVAVATPVDLGGWISGTVTDAATGQPVPNICAGAINVETGAAAGEMRFRSDASGHYRIGMLGTGTFLVQFLDCSLHGYQEAWHGADGTVEAVPVEVAEGRETTGVDVALVRGPSG